MIPDSVKQRVVDRVIVLQELMSTLNIHLRMPSIQYTLRGAIAGAAHIDRWALLFNPSFLLKYEDEYIEHTVGHEYAHLAASYYGRTVLPHGVEWEICMNLFGLPLREVHTYSMSHMKAIKRVWKCGCMEHYVSAYVQRQLLKGMKYECENCGQAVGAVTR